MKFISTCKITTVLLLILLTCHKSIHAQVSINSTHSNITSSNWNTDEDSDGIADDEDLCPTVYDYSGSNLKAKASDKNDVCIPTKINKYRGIQSLYAEVITEFGGWFKFKSTKNIKYNGYAVIYWSEDKDNINSTKKLNSILKSTNQCRDNREYHAIWKYKKKFNCKLIQIKEDFNVLRSEPVIIYDMKSNTEYFLTIRFINRDKNKSNRKPGNILHIKTLNLSLPRAKNNTHPRIFSTKNLLSQWKLDIDSNKTKFSEFIKSMRAEISQVVNREDGKAGYHQHFCLPAMTLNQITGEKNDLSNALILFKRTLDYWKNTKNFSGDSYRFQREALTYCTDAVWNYLTNEQIKEAAQETISNALASMGSQKSRRFTDTDQFVSLTRSYLAVGFTFCNESVLPHSLSNQACNVLDEGLRRWYGGLLPMARKNYGRFGNSDGYLPDGTTYEKGTMGYWIDNFWMMLNMGYDMNPYQSFLANNFLSAKIHSTTPSRKGYFSHSDVQNYYYSGRWMSDEVNTIDHRIYFSNSSLRQSALLARMGNDEMQLRIQKFIASKKEAPIKDGNIFDRLMFLKPVEKRNYYTGLTTTYIASGYGMIFDRLDWSEDSAYEVISAGWGGFDHNSIDTGNLSIYRNKEWFINHNIGYGGVSAKPEAFNVARYTTKLKGKMFPYMYPLATGKDVEIRHSYSSKDMSYYTIETTGFYNSARENSYFYDQVERSIFWFKNKQSDNFIIIDYAKTNDSYPENKIQLAINLSSVNGRFVEINNTSAMLSNNKQQAIINFSPSEGIVTSKIYNLDGMPNDFDPFKSEIYSNYIEYILTDNSVGSLQNEISIQIFNYNVKPPIHSEHKKENWKIIVLGDNVLIYPLNKSLIKGSSLSLNTLIEEEGLEYKDFYIVGLESNKNISFKIKKITDKQYSIRIGVGGNVKTDINGMAIIRYHF